MSEVPTSSTCGTPGFPPKCSTSSRWKRAKKCSSFSTAKPMWHLPPRRKRELANALDCTLNCCLVTLWSTLLRSPVWFLYIRMIKAIAMGIAMVHKDKKKTLEILAGNVADRLGIQDDAELEIFYQRMRTNLEPRLCPKITSLHNAYRIAELVYPELEEKGNPVKLWDLHYIRMLEAQGFFDEIYR